MYIRRVSRKNKDGSVVRYLQLAENEWDSKAGYAKAKILYNFGREENLDREALKRLAASIARFLTPEEMLQTQAEGSPLQFVSSRPLGGAWTLAELWRQLGIEGVIKSILKSRHFRTPVERAIFAMVANRALAPSSKLAVEEWVAQDVVIPGLSEVPVQQLYRAMDFLISAAEQVQREVFHSVADLLNLEVDLLFFDTTSTYFETEQEYEEEATVAEAVSGQTTADETTEPVPPDKRAQTLRRRGHSKDSRPDLPQAVIGLAVTRKGIPVRCWTWSGNTTDMSVVKEVKDDLVGWKLGRVITVVDRGFASEENLRYLQRTGGHYIAGERLRAGKAEVEEALSRGGRYQVVQDNLHVKSLWVGEGVNAVHYILAKNPQEAERDRAQREAIIAALEEELAAIKDLDDEPHSRAVCQLLAHKTYGRYLYTDEQGHPHIHYDKIAEEARLDGKYLIRTSDDTLSAEDVALGYKQLLEVEDAFRTLKTTLDLRPVYHRLDDRIRAHVLLCWLALLLIRVAEYRTGQTWRTLRSQLDRMHVGEFVGPDGRVLQRTETTREQDIIFKALKISEPPRFFAATAAPHTDA